MFVMLKVNIHVLHDIYYKDVSFFTVSPHFFTEFRLFYVIQSY